MFRIPFLGANARHSSTGPRETALLHALPARGRA
jgi:hypothetical protein